MTFNDLVNVAKYALFNNNFYDDFDVVCFARSLVCKMAF